MADHNSPIHLAVKEGNNKCVTIILHFLSKTQYKGMRYINELFHYLVEYRCFLQYLEELPVQTQAMLKKKVLKVSEPLSEQIVSMEESSTIYIDDLFFAAGLGENKLKKNYKSYPVKVVSFRIDWILNDIDG